MARMMNADDEVEFLDWYLLAIAGPQPTPSKENHMPKIKTIDQPGAPLSVMDSALATHSDYIIYLHEALNRMEAKLANLLHLPEETKAAQGTGTLSNSTSQIVSSIQAMSGDVQSATARVNDLTNRLPL
jgi:transcriptional accessory protein Tex/SPT6